MIQMCPHGEANRGSFGRRTSSLVPTALVGVLLASACETLGAGFLLLLVPVVLLGLAATVGRRVTGEVHPARSARRESSPRITAPAGLPRYGGGTPVVG